MDTTSGIAGARTARLWSRLAVAAISLPLGAFFGFVGFMKATAPLAELALHEAWSVHLPEWAGRLVGISEMACAALLLVGLALPRWRKAAAIAALVLVANQAVAALVHARADEAHHLPQNALLALALLGVALVHRMAIRSTGETR